MENMATVEVDLRSDTVTKPTPEMRKAMAEAEVGDDVYGEDPTIKKLEKMAATIMGKEAALFVPSGTMGNLASIMSHCWERGREIIIGNQSHIYLYEQGSCAQLAGVYPRIVSTNSDGTFDLEELRSQIRLNPDSHECITGLICLENTNNRCGGAVVPTSFVKEVCRMAKEWGLPVHMDGARIFNAAVYLGESVADIVRGCDSVSMCLSKGLGAPSGTVIAGTAKFISRAHRCRKLLGGAMRQVGILGAAGILAIQSAADRLKLDHNRAKSLAKAVEDLNSPLLTVNMNQVQTNMVILHCNTRRLSSQQFVDRMLEVTEDERKVVDRQIVVKLMVWSPTKVRCVFHSDIHNNQLQATIEKMRYVIASFQSKQAVKIKIDTVA